MLVNKERAIGFMKQFGIDAMIATMPDNVTYLSDYAGWGLRVYQGTTTKKGTQAYALLPRDEGASPVLITGALVYLAQEPSWIEEVYTFGPPAQAIAITLPKGGDFPEEALKLQQLSSTTLEKRSVTSGEALVKALKDRRLDRAVIALDKEGISPEALERLKSDCPQATIKDGGEFFRYVRMVKTSEELGRMRQAATINEKAIRAIIHKLAPGVSENELASEHRVTVTQGGALPEFINVPAGRRAGTLWEPSDYRLQAGDLIWMDGGCIYKHYHADTGTTAILGEPTERMRDLYRVIDSALMAALSAVKAGARCSEVVNAMHSDLKAQGIERPFGFGHAIGIEPRDLPMLQAPFGEFSDEILKGSNDLPLETNMVLNIEVPFFEWGFGGMQKEHTIVVTERGYKFLTHQDRKLEVIR